MRRLRMRIPDGARRKAVPAGLRNARAAFGNTPALHREQLCGRLHSVFSGRARHGEIHPRFRVHRAHGQTKKREHPADHRAQRAESARLCGRYAVGFRRRHRRRRALHLCGLRLWPCGKHAAHRRARRAAGPRGKRSLKGHFT